MNFLYDVPVEATVDGIKIHYDGGEVVVVYDVSDGDVVRLTIEPLEVKVTDGFRAAVKKACNCDSSSGGGSGGSTGGGVLILHDVDGTLDKTYQDIMDSMTIGGAVLVADGGFGSAYGIDAVHVDPFAGKYIVSAGESGKYICTTPDGYPEYDPDA